MLVLRKAMVWHLAVEEAGHSRFAWVQDALLLGGTGSRNVWLLSVLGLELLLVVLEDRRKMVV
jgi:hypothetical protein